MKKRTDSQRQYAEARRKITIALDAKIEIVPEDWWRYKLCGSVWENAEKMAYLGVERLYIYVTGKGLIDITDDVVNRRHLTYLERFKKYCSEKVTSDLLPLMKYLVIDVPFVYEGKVKTGEWKFFGYSRFYAYKISEDKIKELLETELELPGNRQADIECGKKLYSPADMELIRTGDFDYFARYGNTHFISAEKAGRIGIINIKQLRKHKNK